MSQVLLVLLLEGWDLLPCEFRVRFGFLFRWNSVPPIREGLFSRFCHFFFLFYLRMAQLMSAPWIACGAVRFDSCEHKNSRGFRNGWNVGVSRPRTDFLATCEVRPSLCSRRSSSRSGLRLVESHQGRDEVGVVAGLIEETEETLISEGAGGDGVAVVTAEANVDLNVDDLGNNTRKVEATIAIQAPLEAVWGVLTDYDHLADHIPGLAESSVLQRRSNGARLKQVLILPNPFIRILISLSGVHGGIHFAARLLWSSILFLRLCDTLQAIQNVIAAGIKCSGES